MHDPSFVKQLSRDTGLSYRTIKLALDDLIKFGHLTHDGHGGYIATIKANPPR
jgi:hypothetical protein